jgi:predicted nucleic acid-binding protein
VTGWLLDTNVLSELRRPKPDRKVVTFIAAQPLELPYVSAVTLAEIRFGIEVVTDATKLPVMAALDFAAQLHRHRLLAVADAQLHKALVVRPQEEFRLCGYRHAASRPGGGFRYRGGAGRQGDICCSVGVNVA